MKPALHSSTLCLTLVAIALVISACGQGFRPATAIQDYQTKSLDLKEFLAGAQATPLSAYETTQLGISSSVPMIRYSTNLDVDYGDIARALKLGEKLARAAAWHTTDCNNYGADPRPANQRYSCNEIPYGQILDGQNKLLETIDIDPMSGSQSGVSYSVTGTKVPILLSRQQRRAYDTIQHLTTGNQKSVVVNEDLLKNVYYRFAVDNGRLLTDICLFSPGLSVASSAQNINLTASKRVLFFKLGGKANFRIDPGSLSFSKAKVCTRFETVITTNKADLQLKQMTAPEMTQLAHKGLSVNVDVQFTGILKLLSGLAHLIGINIEKKIEDKVEQRILAGAADQFQQLTREDIETGDWLSKYVSGAIFKGKIVKSLETGLGSSSTLRGPGSQVYLNSILETGCKLLAKTQERGLRGEFEKICRNSFDVRATLFSDSSIDRANGCYSSYFSTSDLENTGQLPWWVRGCKIRNYLEVYTTEDLAPLYNCIGEMFHKDPRQLAEVGACKNEIQWLESRLKDQDFRLIVDQLKGRVKANSNESEITELIKDKFADLF